MAQLALPDFEKLSYLWSGGDSPRDSYYRDYDNYKLGKVMKLVDERRENADGLIMVTHVEVAEEFSAHFLEKEFGRNEYIGKISKGESVHFDLEGKRYQILPQRQ